jgi:hypothetical protein
MVAIARFHGSRTTHNCQQVSQQVNEEQVQEQEQGLAKSHTFKKRTEK